MNYNPKYHHRRSIRLKEFDYSTPWWYYVTICTHNHKKFFGKIESGKMTLNNLGKIVEEEWLNTKQLRDNVDLDYYVIMPNHFHGILIIENSVGATRRVARIKERATLQAGSLGAIIGQFKSKVTRRIRKDIDMSFRWQRNYYEHIIRDEKDLYNIRRYIERNPLKWELDEYYT